MAENNGNGSSSDNATDKLFRRESIVTDIDLRVDVADQISKIILGDEDVTLNSTETHVRGDMTTRRGSRNREVTGNYEDKVDHADTRMVQQAIREVARGGVELRAAVESETIMGGSYSNAIIGPYLRLCVWSDFLAWGGWVEADLARVEITELMIRAHMAYAHAAAVRITKASTLIDDFQVRHESFGVFDDSKTTETNIGSPGSGTTLEA